MTNNEIGQQGPPNGAMGGARKAAILAVALGEQGCKEIFKHLREDEIERILREITTIGTVPTKTSEQVLEEFHTMCNAGDAGRGDADFARRLVNSALGADTARRMHERVTRSSVLSRVFAKIEKADPRQFSKFLADEHPQTIAVLLAHIRAPQAAQIVALLPESARVEVLIRMANLDQISPDAVARISSVIEHRLRFVSGSTQEAPGGVRAVAQVLSRLDRSISRTVLEAIVGDSPDLAVQIREKMFVFDDLLKVNDGALREIAQQADKRTLNVALKGASDDIRQRFFQNMSKRAAEMMKEEMQVLGTLRAREVNKAQQEIVAIATKLEQEGIITLDDGTGEEYVA